MENVVVSFEKVNGKKIKLNTKARRKDIPGIIEREEIARADLIEADLYVHQLLEKYNWYPTMD